ncbi:methyltransferase domain-containing protein [Devosia rhodophyticola]|uniref:Methyltransferase domain-containing protein n=1 Tax=Devosia rhodophyticola TaxID=3026423 RepID=A0ABY7YU17_9HYPH|nr:class I SAM-dependent methyltransferase [Devosia rhodophyticola]WDR04687.1 methyltransferase domain-containing protein [Devosia rhodophyticola]
MAQNIYDQPAFFAQYSQLPRSREGLAGAPEWPVVRAMLPPLANKRVLDLGCGFGAFCRWAHEQGAAKITGVDLSEKMLQTARERGLGLPIDYQQADLAHYQPDSAGFDLVFSSLAVHYLADFDALCARLRDGLRAGGGFVFSMEHPIFATRATPDWINGDGDNRAWAITDYGKEGERVTNWLADGVVKYHRKLSTCLNSLLANGFVLDAIEEWTPTSVDLAQNPQLADEIIRPMLLIVGAHKASTITPPA